MSRLQGRVLSGQIDGNFYNWSPPRINKPTLEFMFHEMDNYSERELNLLRGIWENMRDVGHREVYADWLEEQSRPNAAFAVRHGYVPGYGMSILEGMK